MEKPAALPALPHVTHCRKLLRHYDWERYLLSLFFTPPLRELQWVLGAFNVEVARTAETVSEAAIGAIRLKWWQEVLEMIEAGKPPRQHPVVQSLDVVVRHYRLPLGPLFTVISAREADLGQGIVLPDIAALDRYATETGAGPWLPLTALAPESEQRNIREYLTQLGQLWALLGLLRATAYHWRRGKTYIPQEVWQAHGLETLNFDHPPEPEKLVHLLEVLGRRIQPAMKSLEKQYLPSDFQYFRKAEILLRYYLRQGEKNILQLLNYSKKDRWLLPLRLTLMQ